MPSTTKVAQMSSTPSLPPNPAANARGVRSLWRYRCRKPLKHRAPLRDSICEDTWTCWPHSKIQEKPVQIPEIIAAVSEKKMTGFSLYAVPPTPPPRKYHLNGRPLRHSTDTFSTSGLSQPETDIDWLTDGPVPSMYGGFGLERVPTSLKFWKPRTGTSSSYSSYNSPCRDRGSKAFKRVSTIDSRYPSMDNHKRLPRDRTLVVPIRRNESRIAQLRGRAGPKGHKHQRSNSASESLGHWLDMDEGLIDRKRLSTYLGDVLGSSFNVPNLDHLPRQTKELVSFETAHPAAMKPGPLNLNPPRPFPLASSSASLPCECTAETVLCQGKSSPEFKIFNRWPIFRKSQFGVSSTARRVPVTCAHQENRSPRPRTPQLREIALSHSPTPSLYENTENSEDRDWSELISSSQEEEILVTPPRIEFRPRTHHKAAETQDRDRRSSSGPVKKTQPPPSSYKSIWNEISAPQTAEPGTPGKSSFSSFDFDFDFDSKRHFQRALSVPCPRISDQVIQRHLRNSHIARVSSKPLPSVKVATVARKLSSKPALVTHQKNHPTTGPRVQKTIISQKDGKVEVSTRVQILRPMPEHDSLEVQSTQAELNTLKQRSMVADQRTRSRTPMHDRPLSRLTSDGSPVLGQVGMMVSHQNRWGCQVP